MHDIKKGLVTNMHGIIMGLASKYALHHKGFLASNMHNVTTGLTTNMHDIIRGFGFIYMHKPQVIFMYIFHKSKWFQVFMPTFRK